MPVPNENPNARQARTLQRRFVVSPEEATQVDQFVKEVRKCGLRINHSELYRAAITICVEQRETVLRMARKQPAPPRPRHGHIPAEEAFERSLRRLLEEAITKPQSQGGHIRNPPTQ